MPGNPDHVMYVWLDALNNYVTACGFPDEHAQRWPFWPANVHAIGKEIVRFHAIYWPAFLMSAGLPPPRRVTANGWWVVEGEKMSKSLGNVLEARELAATYGVDQVRYFLLREKPFGGDGNISKQAIITRINGELANELGNLAQRTLSLIARNCSGKLPSHGAANSEDAELLDAAAALPAALRERIDRQAFYEALEDVWKVVRAANAYIDRQAPWALRRTDPVRIGSSAARAGQYASHPRHHAAACHARLNGPHARPAWRPVRRAQLRGTDHAAAGRHRASAARRRLPALRRRGVGQGTDRRTPKGSPRSPACVSRISPRRLSVCRDLAPRSASHPFG